MLHISVYQIRSGPRSSISGQSTLAVNTGANIIEYVDKVEDKALMAYHRQEPVQ